MSIQSALAYLMSINNSTIRTLFSVISVCSINYITIWRSVLKHYVLKLHWLDQFYGKKYYNLFSYSSWVDQVNGDVYWCHVCCIALFMWRYPKTFLESNNRRHRTNFTVVQTILLPSEVSRRGLLTSRLHGVANTLKLVRW